VRQDPSLTTGEPGGAVPLIRARGLALGYGARPVLTGIDLDVQRGDFWCLIGPNGSGKSTLLRGVLGLLRPLDGTLEVAPELGGGRRIGFVPQRCDLKTTLPLAVAEFVELGLTGTGLRRSQAAVEVAWALDRVGLGSQRARDYWALSGGQRQRVLIARGLVRRPRLLILDEPTSGLDLAAEEAVLRLVQDLHGAEGLTILFVTHALGLAARFASHVALFTAPRVMAGPCRSVFRGDVLRQAFGVPIDVAYDPSGRPCVHFGAAAGHPEASP
jgi:ABC-type Mn2+/Zn2+ transport system ATPase subunit